MKAPRACLPGLVIAALGLCTAPASAFPGFFAYKGGKPVNRSTHVVLMKRDATTVVTVMADYEGDLKPFAVVMPVPADVKVDQVKTLRRDFVDRVDQVSAPRFHEFWEMDPCEPGKVEQEWERDLKVSGSGFLGMDFSGGEGANEGPKFKPSKEMALAVDAEFKSGEQTFSILPSAAGSDLAGALKKKGYSTPEGTNEAAAKYVKAGMNFLLAEVDTKTIELAGSDRAIVSPIRFATKEPFDVNSTIGLLSIGDKQELFVYVIHPEQRFEVKNYPNVFPPTNIEVDFKVKERMGEFYAALHDKISKRAPLAFLDEYAWSTKGCGQPCPNEPFLIHELLSLGADVFEESVPKEEAHPKPEQLKEEEQKILEDMKDKKKKKEIEELLKETARRKALIARNVYVLSRMHHRYDKSSLPKDIELGPAGAVRGGVDIPKGQFAELPTEVKPAAENQLQIRYTSFHASPAVAHCESPEKFRWGKAPRTYRGLRKIWVAQDMATKNRTSHDPAKFVYTPIASLELAGQPKMLGGIAERIAMGPAPSASAAPAEGEGSEKKGGCGCRTTAASPAGGPVFSLLALGSIAGLLRRAGRGRRALRGRRAS